MGASPNWKIYTQGGDYEAACKSPDTAAALVAILGRGATVRYGHRLVVWTEGSEQQSAGESYDFAAGTMRTRARSAGGQR